MTKRVLVVALVLALAGSAQAATIDPVANTLIVRGHIVGTYLDYGDEEMVFLGRWTLCQIRMVIERRGRALRHGC